MINAFNRPDFDAISRWIEPGERVLDLGCGDGALLAMLRETHGVNGYGVEIDDDKVLACVKRQVNVIQSNLEAGLLGFSDASFDHVILSQTLQAMHRTEAIVLDMLRVGREAIVSFPNFGYWKLRLQNLKGRMPISKTLPYQWYDTPNVHLCTVADFEQFCRDRGVTILDSHILEGGKTVRWLPNLRGNLAVFRIRRAG